ncbi:MAG TPA: hypothetical protein G4O00_12145 [Thermoflexia bacterium]|nr:hypothetical protein [Thermoflexia bacterium]
MRRGIGYLTLLSGLAALAGAVGPWIPHPAVGLRVAGFDLFEMTGIFPAVRAGAVPVFREAFVLPLLLSALVVALAPVVDRRLPSFLRWVCPVLGAALALTALPPYPAILTAYRDPMYRLRFYLTVGAVLLAATSPLLRRLSPRTVGGGLAALAAVGFGLPLAQYIRVRPLFDALYGRPVGVGWGLILYLAGMGLLFLLGLATLLAFATPETQRAQRFSSQ